MDDKNKYNFWLDIDWRWGIFPVYCRHSRQLELRGIDEL
jgi:hypothetical protein